MAGAGVQLASCRLNQDWISRGTRGGWPTHDLQCLNSLALASRRPLSGCSLCCFEWSLAFECATRLYWTYRAIGSFDRMVQFNGATNKNLWFGTLAFQNERRNEKAPHPKNWETQSCNNASQCSVWDNRTTMGSLPLHWQSKVQGMSRKSEHSALLVFKLTLKTALHVLRYWQDSLVLLSLQ